MHGSSIYSKFYLWLLLLVFCIATPSLGLSMKFKFTDKSIVIDFDEDTKEKIYDSWTEEYATLEDIQPEMLEGIEYELISYRCSECKIEIPTKNIVEAKFGVCKKCKGKI